MSDSTPLNSFPAEIGSSKPDPILTVDDMVRTFGGLRAVDINHLEVQRGIITAFIGPNGEIGRASCRERV